MNTGVALGSIVVAGVALVIVLALIFGIRQKLQDVEEYRGRRRQRREQWLKQLESEKQEVTSPVEVAEKWYQSSFKAALPESRTNALLRSLYNQNEEIIQLLKQIAARSEKT